MQLIKLFGIQLHAHAGAEAEISGAKSGCPTKCGNLTIPYPFGIGIQCARDEGLYFTCDTSHNPPRPYVQASNLEVLAISATEVRVNATVAYKCYSSESHSITHDHRGWMSLATTHYTFSEKSNKFVSIGCNTIAFIQGPDFVNYTSGCFTVCSQKNNVVSGSCAGVGCCQTSIPKGLAYFESFITRPYTEWNVDSYRFSPCSYAFLADQKVFQFEASDINAPDFYNKTRGMPVVLDWVVDNVTCEDAHRNLDKFACQENTICNDSDNGPGYRCSCIEGYDGNPYLTPGCQDIDECEDSSRNECVYSWNCINLAGTYDCTCPHGTHGDGRKNGTGCIQESKDFPAVQVTLGIALGLALLLTVTGLLSLGLIKRRVARQREKFFKQNGGLLLQQHQLSSHEGGAIKLTRIYSAEELKAATNNYDESRILGRGGNGTVYKGIFSGDQTETVAAIKKSRIVDETQIEQFINEVVILTQINHRNVVKLFGCCLETEVPLLVYEYISNGTLYEHIHSRTPSSISWQKCLRIVTETAGALAYLHSAASIPIIHRDVKSANILLDDNYNTKVADFGASRLIPLDQTQISTLVQGTLGYLDPISRQAN